MASCDFLTLSKWSEFHINMVQPLLSYLSKISHGILITCGSGGFW